MPSPTDACHGVLRVRAMARLTTGHAPAGDLFEVRGSRGLRQLLHRQGLSLWPLRRQWAQQRARRRAWLATAWLLDGDWATERLADSRGGRSEGQG